MTSYLRTLPDPNRDLAPSRLDSVQLVEEPTPLSEDIQGIFQALRRNIWLFVATVLCALGAAIAWLQVAVPIYSATAMIVLDPPRQVVPNSTAVLADAEPDSSVVDTQEQIIDSRTVVGRVADRMTLLSEQIQPLSRDQRIDAMRNALSVSRVALSRALTITFESPDPAEAAEVANAVVAAYMDHQLEAKQQATREANAWLSQSVAQLRVDLAEAEAAVESYRANSGLLVAKGVTSTESEVTDLDFALSAARKDLSAAEAKLQAYERALAQSGAASAADIVGGSTMMDQLRTQQAALLSQRAQLSPTLGAQHPQMVELDRQVASVQQQMTSEARRTANELRNDIAVAANRVAGLQAIRDNSRQQLATDNSANVQLVSLQSNAESLRALYEAMLTRLQQTASQESLGQVNATVVSSAVVPLEPSSPNRPAILAAALAAGIVLGVLAALLSQILDQTIVRPEDIERKTHLPLLALVPELKAADLKMGSTTVEITDFVFGKPMSLFTEAFRSLRVAVSSTGERGQAVVVQFTSGTFAEGKTLSSIAFARTAALDGKRVLLIDADTRRRSLTQRLGLDADVGLAEVLNGEAELENVIVAGSVSARRPWIVPLARASNHAYDLFSTKAFEQLLAKVRKNFDLIVIDSAPVLAVAEPASIASRVDAVILIARWAKTPSSIVLKALEEIRRAGGRVIGTVLTQVDVKTVTTETYGRKHYPALMKYYR